MVRILLDTHLFLWAISDPARLSPVARTQIEASEVFVSAASIWEIAIKASIRKLDADPAEILAAVEPAGFGLLSITGDHAAKVAVLPQVHRDPFDRLLVAQALVEPMILLTNDAALSGYGALVTVA